MIPSGQPYVHPTLQNLEPALRESHDLDTLAREVIDDATQDRADRAEWEEMHAAWVDMYYQRDKPAGAGTSYAMADDSLPLLTEATQRWHERAYGTMFADRRLVRVLATGRSSEALRERAERISLHMTWQLTVQNRDYRRTLDRLLLHVPLHGSGFLKTYRDPRRNLNRTDLVRATDLLVPYGAGPKRLEEIERKTQIVWTTVNAARQAQKAGWISLPEGEECREVDSSESSWKPLPDERADDAQGIHPTGDRARRADVLWLESHRLVDFDGDGIAEPYVVTVDVGSQRVIRVVIRYETDEAGNPLEASWPDYKRPFEYFTHFNFIENPDGFYGLGLGHLLGQINKAANRLLRIVEDAGTLSTFGNLSGFISNAAGGPGGGEIELVMGKLMKISGGTDDISKLFKTFDFKGPSPVLQQVLGLLLERSDRLGLTTEAVTGQTEKVMQPTTILALLEESGKGFNAVNERIVDAWGDELAKHYRLNRLHLDPVEYFNVMGVDGAQVEGMVSRTDYADDLRVAPAVDPQMRSEKSRLQRAEVEYQAEIANPLVQQSVIHFYNASKRYLQALRVENIEEVLPNPAMMLPAQLIAAQAAIAGMGKDSTGLPNANSNSGAGAPAQSGGTGGPPGAPGLPMAPGAAPNDLLAAMAAGQHAGGVAPGAGAGGSAGALG